MLSAKTNVLSRYSRHRECSRTHQRAAPPPLPRSVALPECSTIYRKTNRKDHHWRKDGRRGFSLRPISIWGAIGALRSSRGTQRKRGRKTEERVLEVLAVPTMMLDSFHCSIERHSLFTIDNSLLQKDTIFFTHVSQAPRRTPFDADERA